MQTTFSVYEVEIKSHLNSAHISSRQVRPAASKPGSNLWLRAPLSSVIKVWDVIVGVTAVTFGSIVGDAQVVKSREENKDSDDQNGDGAIAVLGVIRKTQMWSEYEAAAQLIKQTTAF